MRKTMIMVIAMGMAAITSFGQQKVTNDIAIDKSFEDAGAPPPENVGYHLAPKFCKAGEELSPQPPIALSAAKKEALELGKAKPSQLRKDCLNIIYTVDPIYKDGIIQGVVRGTIVMKWDLKKGYGCTAI